MSYLNNYIIYLASVKNRAEGTIEEYERDITEFLDFVGKEVKDITIQDGRTFMVHLDKDNNNNSKTRARKVSAIRGFYNYLFQEEGIDSNIRGLEKPKVDKTLPKYLTIDECQRLLKVCNEGELAERDYCIITLFLNCGFRLSELVNIKLDDIKDNNTLVINGKGSKERTVYLNDNCMVALKRYLKVRNSNNEYLFISNRGTHVTNRCVQEMIKHNLSKIGRSDLSTHKLRHSCATMYYNNGVDILALKEILGHESVATTQIYTHVNSEQIKNIMAHSPLSA